MQHGPTPAPTAPVVTLRRATKKYETGSKHVIALEQVDLDLGAGELIVVLGPSGCGKTTLLNLIGALDTPSSGQVVVAGMDISHSTRRELSKFRRSSVSFVFQSFNLFPGLTAEENVRFAADVSARPDPARVARQALADVGLADRATHFPHELSGGEQQRVSIARALASGNPVILADEPTGELDFRTGIQILTLLVDQARSGRTVVLVTHNREIARIADRVVELSSGRVVHVGPPRDPATVDELRW